MRRWIALTVLALAVAGCEQPAKQPESPVAVVAPTMVAPDFGVSSRIGLLRQRGKLRVGDSFDRALDLFQGARRAREFQELPSRLAAPYKAHGWETTAEGFGVILYEARVAAALHTLEKATDEQVMELVDAYQDEMRMLPELVSGQTARYWFWEVPRVRLPNSDTVNDPKAVKQRLMVCAVRDAKGTFTLTEAMGDVFAMNAIKANMHAAEADVAAADQLMQGVGPKS